MERKHRWPPFWRARLRPPPLRSSPSDVFAPVRIVPIVPPPIETPPIERPPIEVPQLEARAVPMRRSRLGNPGQFAIDVATLSWDFVRGHCNGLLLAVCLVAWINNAGKPPGPSTGLAYAALFMGGVVSSRMAFAHWNLQRGRGFAAFCIGSAFCLTWLHFDSYCVAHRDGATRIYTDHSRWSGDPFYRSIHTDSKAYSGWYRGPLSATGKQHGEWSVFESRRGWFDNRKEWYWYGEELTEGQWHLRNDR